MTYLALFGAYCAASYITSIWEPLIILGSTAGKLAACHFRGPACFKAPSRLHHAWQETRLQNTGMFRPVFVQVC